MTTRQRALAEKRLGVEWDDRESSCSCKGLCPLLPCLSLAWCPLMHTTGGQDAAFLESQLWPRQWKSILFCPPLFSSLICPSVSLASDSSGLVFSSRFHVYLKDTLSMVVFLRIPQDLDLSPCSSVFLETPEILHVLSSWIPETGNGKKGSLKGGGTLTGRNGRRSINFSK